MSNIDKTNKVDYILIYLCKLYVWSICWIWKIKPDHGYEHALFVMKMTHFGTFDFPDMTPKEKMLVCLAALMHDIDDRKIFPSSDNYDNARQFLGIISRLNLISRYDAYIVLKMIKLVSYSKNKNEVLHKPLWMYLPRDADRIAAGGYMGITRTLEFNEHNTKYGKSPMYIDSDIEMIKAANFAQSEFNMYCLNYFIEKFKNSTETDRSSIFMFYLTDWAKREQCASQSPRLNKIIKKEYNFLAKWIVSMIREKANKYSIAINLVNAMDK